MSARDEFREKKKKNVLDTIIEIVYQETAENEYCIPVNMISSILGEEYDISLSPQSIGNKLKKVMHWRDDDPFEDGIYTGFWLTSKLGYSGGWMMTDNQENLRHRSDQEVSYDHSRKAQHRDFVGKNSPEIVILEIDENVY